MLPAGAVWQRAGSAAGCVRACSGRAWGCMRKGRRHGGPDTGVALSRLQRHLWQPLDPRQAPRVGLERSALQRILMAVVERFEVLASDAQRAYHPT